MLHTIERFNQQAVKHNLSAGAILLWQHLFFTMERRNQFADVHQNTAALIAQLEVTRQGLQMMRQTLVNKGFLEVRVDEHQQTFYTLMIDRKVVGEHANINTIVGEGSPFPQAMDNRKFMIETGISAEERTSLSTTGLTVNTAPDFPISHKSAQNDKDYPSGDIILNNKFRPYIDTFCEQYGYALRTNLLEWAEMRRKNGWTLTLWGLEEAFKKLITLSNGDASQMIEIVSHAVEMRWKNFYPVNVKAKPSGAKLRALEAKENASANTKNYSRNSYRKLVPEPKFKPEGRDLSFLER